LIGKERGLGNTAISKTFLAIQKHNEAQLNLREPGTPPFFSKIINAENVDEKD